MKIKFSLKYDILIAVVIAIILSISGCKNSNNDNKIPPEPKPSTVLKIPTTVDIPGQYILILKKPIASLPSISENNTGKQQAQLTKKKKIKGIHVFDKLFAYLKIKEENLKVIYKNIVVVKLDTIAAKRAKKDKRFQHVEQDYRVVNPFGKPVYHSHEYPRHLVYTPQTDNNWGVLKVLTTARQNINSTKRVFLMDGGVDKDHPALNIDTQLSQSFVTNEKYYDLGLKDFYHGTHVAGIIGAKNNERSLVGVAPNAKIVVFKVIHEDTMNYHQYLKALKAVFDNSKPGDILNLSFENTKGLPGEVEAIQKIAQKGVFVVIAAGNDHRDIVAHPVYPAMITGKNIYTVAAVTEDRGFANFSNFGKPIVIYCAPGDDIYSTIPHKRYAYDGGTSQAAPMVSGMLYLGCSLNSSRSFLCNGDKKTYLMVHE